MESDREKSLRVAAGLAAKGAYARALAEYKKLALEGPGDPAIAMAIGELQIKVRAFNDAVAAYELAGATYAKLGDLRRGIDAYRRALDAARLCPRLDERAVRIARALACLHGDEGTPCNPVASFVPLERRLAREGNTRAALAVMRLVVELDPEGTVYRRLFGEALARSGDLAAALVELSTCAEMLIDRGVDDEAIEVLERILELRPDLDHARLAAERYLARGAEGDGMRALLALEPWCKRYPRDRRTLALLASALRLAGNSARAQQIERLRAQLARDEDAMAFADTFTGGVLAP